MLYRPAGRELLSLLTVFRSRSSELQHPAELAESRVLLPTLVRPFRVMLLLVQFLNAPLRKREGSPQP